MHTVCKYQILFYYQLLNSLNYSIEIGKGFVKKKTGLGKPLRIIAMSTRVFYNKYSRNWLILATHHSSTISVWREFFIVWSLGVKKEYAFSTLPGDQGLGKEPGLSHGWAQWLQRRRRPVAVCSSNGGILTKLFLDSDWLCSWH